MIPITCIVFALFHVRWHAICHIIRIMDIRIDLKSNGLRKVVQVAGRLSGTAVEELQKTCNSIEDPVVIDLSNLLFADTEGINAIQSIADTGAQVRGASPYIQLLLYNTPGGKTVGGESNRHKWS